MFAEGPMRGQLPRVAVAADRLDGHAEHGGGLCRSDPFVGVGHGPHIPTNLPNLSRGNFGVPAQNTHYVNLGPPALKKPLDPPLKVML